MAILKINFSENAKREQKVIGVPLSNVDAITPAEEDPEGQSKIIFKDLPGGMFAGGSMYVYVDKNFDSLCQLFADAAEKKLSVDLVKITQTEAFSKKPSAPKR